MRRGARGAVPGGRRASARFEGGVVITDGRDSEAGDGIVKNLYVR